MSEQRATTDQQVKVIKKMIAQLEKQEKLARGSENKQRYQQKLKKYTRQLNELSMRPVQESTEEDEHEAIRKELDTTQSTLETYCETSHSESFASLDVGDFLTSPVASPRPSPQTISRRISKDKAKRLALPYDMVQSGVDENGNRIIKFGFTEESR